MNTNCVNYDFKFKYFKYMQFLIIFIGKHLANVIQRTVLYVNYDVFKN